jgi:pimeloyl-ACP methyl ester carboxylesterase
VTAPRFLRWSYLFAILIVVGLAVSWLLGSAMTRPSPSHVPSAIAPARDIHLRTADSLIIAATWWPGARPDAPAVLLLHGNGASRAAMAPTAAWLASQGYAALTIDFRGHGESSPAQHSFGLDESRDAAAAFAWLKQRQHGAPVAVLGSSLGGAAALLGRDGPLPADALILIAVYPDIRHAIRNRIAVRLGSWPAVLVEPLLSYQSQFRFGVGPDALSPLHALQQYRGPVVIIGGGLDRYTPPGETRAMFAAAPGQKRIWWVAGADHSAASGIASGAYRNQLGGFLFDTIGSGGKPGRPARKFHY